MNWWISEFSKMNHHKNWQYLVIHGLKGSRCFLACCKSYEAKSFGPALFTVYDNSCWKNIRNKSFSAEINNPYVMKCICLSRLSVLCDLYFQWKLSFISKESNHSIKLYIKDLIALLVSQLSGLCYLRPPLFFSDFSPLCFPLCDLPVLQNFR